MWAKALLFATMLGVCVPALADDEEVPDLAFFEYLGMWEGSDEEWLVLDELMTAEIDVQPDSATDSEESVEKDDES